MFYEFTLDFSWLENKESYTPYITQKIADNWIKIVDSIKNALSKDISLDLTTLTNNFVNLFDLSDTEAASLLQAMETQYTGLDSVLLFISFDISLFTFYLFY